MGLTALPLSDPDEWWLVWMNGTENLSFTLVLGMTVSSVVWIQVILQWMKTKLAFATVSSSAHLLRYPRDNAILSVGLFQSTTYTVYRPLNDLQMLFLCSWIPAIVVCEYCFNLFPCLVKIAESRYLGSEIHQYSPASHKIYWKWKQIDAIFTMDRLEVSSKKYQSHAQRESNHRYQTSKFGM